MIIKKWSRIDGRIKITDIISTINMRGIPGQECLSDDSDMYFAESQSSTDEKGHSSKKERGSVYNKEASGYNPKLKTGLRFKNKDDLMEAILHHGIINGNDIKFIKNDLIRVTAQCKVNNCR